MAVTVEGIVMLLSPAQPSKEKSPMLVTPSAGITLLLQPRISFPEAISIRQFPALLYAVLLLTTEIDARAPQARNAPVPMLVTEAGIITLVRLPQARNAYLPIFVTPSSIITDLIKSL